MFRLVSWLSTKKGKRFTHICVGGGALTVFGSHISFHGPFLDRLVEVLQVYSYGKPRPIPPKVKGLIKEVLQDSKLKDEQKKKLRFFYVVGHDVFHAGALASPWGAIIGIPFIFEDIQDINFGEIKLHGTDTIDWVLDGQDLIKSLTLSESAKKFALMREINSCDLSDVFTNAVIAGGCVLVPGRFAQQMNIRSNAFEKLSLKQRNIRYALLYACGFIFYRLLKNPLKHLSDQKTDRLVAETGPEYLNGGIEYYKKTLLKNKSLQNLAKSKFFKKYDENGNENYLLLAPRLPVAKRLDYLRDMKKEKMVKGDKKSE